MRRQKNYCSLYIYIVKTFFPKELNFINLSFPIPKMRRSWPTRLIFLMVLTVVIAMIAVAYGYSSVSSSNHKFPHYKYKAPSPPTTYSPYRYFSPPPVIDSDSAAYDR
ncbi:PREDICTED: uncharacterized protein LOC104705527 [Camelina sativa]|uniref:Uncharacterized protein LOC104705527 n=2 Tax=Camelina sativa TaxID=90675 RepID=A0ABM1QCZ1_CAMSA|nr:PREDICTED: uncharacterized protein LOC104705527 [Camelina sativa]